VVRDLRPQERPPGESRHAYRRRGRPIVGAGSGIGTTRDDEARSEFEARESEPATLCIHHSTACVCVLRKENDRGGEEGNENDEAGVSKKRKHRHRGTIHHEFSGAFFSPRGQTHPPLQQVTMAIPLALDSNLGGIRMPSIPLNVGSIARHPPPPTLPGGPELESKFGT
jgi:hypothetical protein